MTGEKRNTAPAAARARLLAERDGAGVWRGRLSSSALSTAVAAVALHTAGGAARRGPVTRALDWLAAHANGDGGWGDSPESPSNLSTTLLAWAALAYADPADAAAARAVRAAEAWIGRAAGSLEPGALAGAVLAAYGGDRTFSAPILAVCALTGRLGGGGWRWVPALPFELALLPPGLFRFMNLSVVSYAIPALIAIGLARHRHPPRGGGLKGWLRDAAAGPALRVLEARQPPNGGFLEAAPLTGFVAASLAVSGYGNHPVAVRCVGFLAETARVDGSWPIDTDLATWLTTLSIRALAVPEGAEPGLDEADRARLRRWLLERQTRGVHPFTRAAPGGWGWTDRPGSVPDADDTAGALLALRSLGGTAEAGVVESARAGLAWLMGLQNRDGGIPTFCRGWGRLPFDRSCPDITAHALRACAAWRGVMGPLPRLRLGLVIRRMYRYLEHSQAADGSWTPLWFGNQATAGQVNPVYGTAQVVAALAAVAGGPAARRQALVAKGIAFLREARNPDGGWGGARGAPSSVEETAMAVTALAAADEDAAAEEGRAWLARRTEGGTRFDAAPIGLYFSRLWYAERLYPLIFTVQALDKP